MLGTGLEYFYARYFTDSQALIEMDRPIYRANRKLIDRLIALGPDESQR